MRDIISPDAAKIPKKFWSFIKGKKKRVLMGGSFATDRWHTPQ